MRVPKANVRSRLYSMTVYICNGNRRMGNLVSYHIWLETQIVMQEISINSFGDHLYGWSPN